MELQIPGLESIQKDLQELKKMISNLAPSTGKEDYIPKSRMFESFDLSASTLRNREQDGSLKRYKIGARVYYKLSEVHALLEHSSV